MRNELQVWCQGEWAGNEPEQGGVAVETVRLCCLRSEDSRPEPLPMIEDAAEEDPIESEPAPPQPPKRKTSQEARHLAGADWLDDWTLYFSPQKKPKPRRLPKN